MEDYEACFPAARSLATFICKASKYTRIHRDDAIQVADIACWRAALTFDSSFGLQFSNWAMIKVDGAVRDYLRSVHATDRFKNVTPRGPPPQSLTRLPREVFRNYQILPPPADCFLNPSHVLSYLPPRSQEIIERYYLGEETQRYIADSYGITEGRVSQIIRESLAKLRQIVSQQSTVS